MEITPPLRYTGTPRDEVQMPLTTTRFADERYLIKPRKDTIRSPNKPQFLKMFKHAANKFMDDEGNRYMKLDEETYYCLVKAGATEYPRSGKTVQTSDGKKLKIKGTYFTPPRATGLVYV